MQDHIDMALLLPRVRQSIAETKKEEQVQVCNVLCEEYAHLHAHLEKLSPIQREALRLRFANGLRCSEIATVLGKRDGTVRVLLSRALNFLRSIYENDQGGILS
ncbi:MAG TPA: sigma factor-like helix-turn-helix DNA-binding protein [Ktedonobacteraceae bacterium]|nr:sigma factor-like helix-turn-helix DNA-binding protein [Ktedonobacteraceae bacterium]